MSSTRHISFLRACHYFTADARWRQKLLWGGFLLMVPAIGWPIILGYRKEVVTRLTTGVEPILPEWSGRLGYYLIEGLRCIGIIFGYLAPVILIVWWKLNTSPGALKLIDWPLYFLAFFICPIFSPLALPGLVVYLSFFAEVWTSREGIAILALYHMLVFLIPLGFLQVSLTGQYRSAWNLKACLLLLRESPCNYLIAWIFSSGVSLIGHFCLPLSPWGVVWAYLAIVFYFNQILYLNSRTRTLIDGRWFGY